MKLNGEQINTKQHILQHTEILGFTTRMIFMPKKIHLHLHISKLFKKKNKILKYSVEVTAGSVFIEYSLKGTGRIFG